MQNYKVGRWWILFWLFVVGRLQCYGPKLFNDLLHLLLLSLGWWWHGRLLGSHLLGPLLLLRQSLQGLRLQTLPPVLHLLQLLLYLLGSQRGRLGAGSYFGLLWGFGIFKNNLQGRHLILTKFWKYLLLKTFNFLCWPRSWDLQAWHSLILVCQSSLETWDQMISVCSTQCSSLGASDQSHSRSRSHLHRSLSVHQPVLDSDQSCHSSNPSL